MSENLNHTEASTQNHDTKEQKNVRLSWKSRCREMQGVRWGKKSQSSNQRENGRTRFVEGTLFNKEFEKYYKDQKICKEEEWKMFEEYSRIPLPVSFRLNTSSFLWRHTRDKLKQMCDSEDLYLEPCLDYCPEYLKNEEDYNIFFQMKASKSSLRKNENFAQFHQFLMNEDNRGSLCRQETVSMLPVLFLDPKPNENILDFCAAPGMKYLQIVDMVETRLKWQNLDSLKNKGIIVGNDVSQTRVSTLAHHLKSIDSPSTAITNYDATRFPNLYNNKGQLILFDKILADMPCSCDGTMRKSIDIWTNWKATNGLHLHKVQLTILKRGIELLKPGGILIYSTCSLNPLENEAIASYCASNEDVELVDLEPIQGFKTEKGLTDWLVPDLNGGYFSDFSQVNDNLKERIKETMFRSSKWNEEMAKKVMRVLPHYNNTGGFFIFKIRKVTKGLNNHGHETGIVVEEEKKERKKARGSKLLHEYTTFEGPELKKLMDFYGISENLNFLVKVSSDKTLHLVSDDFKAFKRNKNNKLEQCKYASFGSRIFTKLDTKDSWDCEFRVTQEGTRLIHKYFTKRKLVSNTIFLKELLQGSMPCEKVVEHVERGNLVAIGSTDESGKLKNGPLLVFSVMNDKVANPEYEGQEYITMAAVVTGNKLHLYIKEETINSLKVLL
ncbi:methyl transferase, putative [Theileria annulata]|uniref:Methyl transferase, putative n=1 Tax=Theileria annulata TaxID=5874 RepID=Q4UG36_THEAN|nr:methyl transferase, putative [Theileria annulata]CAI73953.1 methyl transferase, putative [Theileria annulata]|eukprot:XP_954630.1 methyl transferase, putative [Theileria annulata]